MNACVSYADSFPLVRSGGVFLVLVGATIMLSAPAFKRRWTILGLGAFAASVATVFLAAPLTAPFGAPTALQIGSLAAAVSIECVAIVWVARALRARGQRTLTLGVLAVVGAHFLVMAPAFGPPIVALGLLTLANAALGAAIASYPMPTVWFVDGLVKLAIGAVMVLGHRLPCGLC